MAQNTDPPVIRLLLGPWAPAISSLSCSSLDGSSSSVEFFSPLPTPVFSAVQKDNGAQVSRKLNPKVWPEAEGEVMQAGVAERTSHKQ